MSILRHEKTQNISSNLDVIEDLLNLFVVLKSKGYTSDLLRNIHGFTNATEINKTTKLISHHIDNAIGLSSQAFAGPQQTSFLPLYYSCLNLIKVYLLFLGKRTDLENNRWHGATYKEKEMNRDFLNEKIIISKKGTIPLVYNTLSNKTIGRKGIEITLGEIYSSIYSISAEYNTVTKSHCNLIALHANFVEDIQHGHHFNFQILDEDFRNNPPPPNKLKAFSGLKLKSITNSHIKYITQKLKGQPDVVKARLLSNVKRYLISDIYERNWIGLTPVSSRHHVLNEDLSILLAYFHLSNVVRYNPEHLYKLMDSKYWAIILALRKHGYLRYLTLMWGNINKTSFDINSY